MSETVQQNVWPVVRQFDAYNVPSFPIEALPPSLKTYVSELAEATQTPVDMAAMLVLSVIASANAKKFIVRYDSGWIEPLNLYVVVAMPPASRKSAVYAECTLPLRKYESEKMDEMRAEIVRGKSQYAVLENRKGKLERDLANATDATKCALLQGQLNEVIEEMMVQTVPSIPRFIVDDVTAEKLTNLLYEQNGKIAAMAPEGDLFEIFTGRYTRGQPNIGVFLKAHSGDELRVDRLGRPSELVKAPALTIGLTIQPEVLRGLIATPGIHGKGLLARFLYSLPISNIGQRKIMTSPLSYRVSDAYQQMVKRLLEFDIGDRTSPISLVMTCQAGTVFNEYRADIEKRLASFNQLGMMRDWGGKLPGAVLRIAGNLHLAECTEFNDVPNIGVETVSKAILIAEYLTEHACCAYNLMGSNPQVAMAKVVWGCIQNKQWNSFSTRELHSVIRSRVRSAQDLDEPLIILVEHGFIRNVVEDTHRAGRPAKKFEVNPAVLGTSTQNTQNTRNTENLQYQPPEIREDSAIVDNGSPDSLFPEESPGELLLESS